MAIWNKIQKAFLPDNKTLFEAFMLSDKDGNIINSFANAANIPIAAGLVDGYTHVNKFGATDGTANGGTIWDGNSDSTVYPYPADSVVAVTSTQNSGASVLVQGLDANFESVSETINIGSTGTTVFSRIFRARMVDVNNDAAVSLTMGGTVAAKILEDQAQTLMCVYTIPAGKTGYLLSMQMGASKAAANAYTQYSLRARDTEDGNVFQIKGINYTAAGQNISHDYPVPLRFEEKTDIRVDVVAHGQGQTCAATLDIVLVDNPA